MSNSTALDHLPASKDLAALQQQMATTHLRDLFAEDPNRFDRYSLEAAGLFLDYSKHLINDEVMASLVKLADQAHLTHARTAMFAGEKINYTEQRAVLHTALRSFGDAPVMVDGQDIMPVIRETRARMQAMTEQVHSGQWLGHTGKPIRHIVNIGIGGSYLGLKTAINALTPYHVKGLEHHFVANIDPNELSEVLGKIDPETTLFIVASKSFGTLETLQNAQAARAWMIEKGCAEQDIRKHFMAISTNLKAIDQFGIAQENTLPLWDWVGGRYSLWSSIGLLISMVVGYDNFERLLKGAEAMDQHFCSAPLAENMPVIAGLLGVWYQNFMGAESHAVISYDYFLRDLPGHLQQVDMESNGKRTREDGSTVPYQTGSVIWGGTGTNDQHAYHQLLHQGTRLIPVDFIAPATTHNPIGEQHPWLFTNALAQSQAMMQGKTLDEVRDELSAGGMNADEVNRLAPHKVIPGNRPNSMIVPEKITPETTGALIALYEHKVFVQGTIWQINSFDQWGVELGKVLGDRLIEKIRSPEETTDQDSSTNGLIKRFKQFNH
ncbi:glucose-6-phosphate isomerase [Endozoicomonas sp. SCSIO W0465]|uniref:glucose-6-phosphate isomerase n=1 Tax=Endozoicomonas sp. SCSIO W0465 TaxID=2918516 RepID=UPI002074FAA0|nr:glucose-6-phosphate isomerase [Endozoicomonas sp. SCSIO W0465]USE37767.1 glucose-6-phosphate isomerase [Endozoicomonas sp. SCSIO W0465]